ncbi:MAG: hypothetical protein LWX83_16985 [Anaerolineae bacterium]|nr:hypothetical protein [Anaerolineae bacterium]
MKKVLVVYITKSGSTAEVAAFIGKELSRSGAAVDVKTAADVQSLSGYDAVILGAPMIMGWHPQALEFLRRHQAALQGKQLSCFVTALSLTQDGAPQPGATLFYDPHLIKEPKNPQKLGFKENFTTVSHYLEPILADGLAVKPSRIAFFGGSLDLSRLDIFSSFFVRFIVGAKAGDYRNWDAIQAWANQLLPVLS